jgi:3'-phosphoadenosine 5'-phosphosulfate sulfotransferase
MPSEFAEADPNAREFTPTDEYSQIAELRTTLNEFKKEVSKVCPSLETKLRAKLSEDTSKVEEVYRVENARIAEILSHLPEYTAKIMPHQSLLKVDYNEIITEISLKAVIEYETKEDYTDFMFLVTKGTKLMFNDMKILLERMKAIKKQAGAR